MKYILELEDEPNKEYFGEGNYYRCKQIPYWSISESMRNRLEPYDEADRKTEPTISKMEQVETMSCQECKHFHENAVMYLDQCDFCFKDCKFEPKDERQTDECAKEYEELGLKELKELINADHKTEQTEREGE